MDTIYLDYAASSLKHFDIYKTVIAQLENIYANPSSSHSLGKKINALLENARYHIAKSINANPNQIIFTSGGTEANNMVFHHIEKHFKNGEIITSNIEHPSVSACLKALEKKGFKIITLNVNEAGYIDINELNSNISDKTVLISIMYANNETGIIQPIQEISKIAKDNQILFHSDIVQAYLKTDIDMNELNIDFASVSAHKIGATNNFGFLYTKSSQISPMIIGGGQENAMRSGTSDIFAALVLEKSIAKTQASIKKIAELKEYFIEQLEKNNLSFEVNGDYHHSLPNIINIYFKHIEAQRLITYLDINNIYISGGSACSSGSIRGSKIIADMFSSQDRADKSVRFSLGFDTTQEKIDATIEKIKNLENRILNRG